ncbi:MAG: DUF362 domain-containing protein [Phycisphaerae bacterium]|nr:DUF362 domain-containing protein [Phycisphaerae bacterium]
MSHPTRRQFLGSLAVGAAAISLPRFASATADGALPAPDGARSRLVSVFNPIVVKGALVNETYLARMLEVGLLHFTGEPSVRNGWRKLLGPKPTPKVLIKFNRSGADAIATTKAMVAVLLDSLRSADIKPDQVMLLDVSPEIQRSSGAAKPILTFEAQPVTVLGKEEHLSAALAWADCLINVPFVKDHYLAGVSCAMKNLSHGLIKTPARWHGDRCRDAIPHLFNLEPIRGKHRVTICNALRIVYDGGPEAKSECMSEYSRLMISSDVVAMDAHAARLIDQVRGAHSLKDLAEERRPPAFLTVARDLKLGRCDLDRLDVVDVDAG